MRFSFCLLATLFSVNSWAGPFELQLMSVAVQGNPSYRFVFPKFSNEDASSALNHYFVNLKAQASLQPLVPNEFRRILSNGHIMKNPEVRSRVLLLANNDFHHTIDSDDIRMISETLEKLGKEAFALPVSAMSGLDAMDRRKFLNLLRKNFGVVMPLGGADIHYSLYGKTASPVDGKMNLQRDLDEIDVVRSFIYTRKFPHTEVVDSRGIIAICRGCQQLGVILGYELVRDIPTQVTRPLNHQKDHSVDLLPTPMNLHRTAINIRTKGPYPLRGSAEVYSRHHQSIKFGTPYPGKGLQLAAISSDGVAEAFETDITQGLGPGVAVQHHPEYASAAQRKKFLSQILISCSFTFGIATPTM